MADNVVIIIESRWRSKEGGEVDREGGLIDMAATRQLGQAGGVLLEEVIFGVLMKLRPGQQW